MNINVKFFKLYYNSIKILVLISFVILFVYIFSKLLFNEADRYSNSYVSIGNSAIGEGSNQNLITNPRMILYNDLVQYSIMADSASYETENEIAMMNPILMSKSINAKSTKLVIKDSVLYFMDNVEFRFDMESFDLGNIKNNGGSKKL